MRPRTTSEEAKTLSEENTILPRRVRLIERLERQVHWSYVHTYVLGILDMCYGMIQRRMSSQGHGRYLQHVLASRDGLSTRHFMNLLPAISQTQHH
jgi:hypothetical protein